MSVLHTVSYVRVAYCVLCPCCILKDGVSYVRIILKHGVSYVRIAYCALAYTKAY